MYDSENTDSRHRMREVEVVKLIIGVSNASWAGEMADQKWAWHYKAHRVNYNEVMVQREVNKWDGWSDECAAEKNDKLRDNEEGEEKDKNNSKVSSQTSWGDSKNIQQL